MLKKEKWRAAVQYSGVCVYPYMWLLKRRGFNTSYCLCKVKRPPAQKIKKMTTIIRAYDYTNPKSKIGTTRRKSILKLIKYLEKKT